MHRPLTFPWSPRFRRSGVVFSIVAVTLLTASTVGLGIGPFGPFAAAADGAGTPSSSPAGGSVGTESPLLPAAAATATLTVAPTSGPVGTEVTFTATDFTHSAAFSIVGEDSVLACSGTTSSKGAFNCTYAIPPVPAGIDNFTGSTTKASAVAAFTVATKLVANPTSGPVGTPILFRGTGFKASDGVGIAWSPPAGGTATVCSATAAANGSFGCAVTLPAAPTGEHAFTGTSSGSTVNATAEFSVLPALTVGPGYGPPATRVTFSGTGFGANDVVAVTWSAGTACSNTTLDTGNFSCAYRIPSGTAGGMYTFTGSNTGSAPAGNATSSFVVTFLRFSPSQGVVGTHVNVTGGGFTPSASVAFTAPATWQGGSVCGGRDASSSGGYSCSFNISATPAGPYLFNASTGVDYATATLTVGPALVLNRTYGNPTTPVEFAGSGFGSSLPVMVSWAPNGSAVTACSTTTSTSGVFTCTGFKIPVWALGGAYTFTAADTASHSAAGTFVVTYLTVTPGSGPRNTPLHIAGGGFAPGSSVNVTWPGGPVCSGPTTGGTFSCTFADTAYAPAGPNNLTANDGHNDVAVAPFSVTPHVAANPTGGFVGATVVFAGTGFARSSLVTVYWENGTVACSSTTGALGAENCSAKVPAVPASSYTFTAKDAHSDTATTLFNVSAFLTLNVTAGFGNTPVRFTGTGFGAGATVTVSSGLGSACGATAASNGTFTCTYTVPNAPSGTYVFTASDTKSNSATADFDLEPSFGVSLASGSVGTSLTFNGNGFDPGAMATVSWAPGGVTEDACSATVLSAGTFGCSFVVPQAPAGNYTFTARDNPGGHTATADFDLLPELLLAPASGPVGTVVTFTGEGFLASSSVTVTWPSGTACPARTTNSSGTFTCQFEIPSTSTGPHLFTAASSPQDSATATFTVNTTLTVSPTRGVVSSTVTINGTGLAASSSITVSWAWGTACVTPTSANGSFSCTYVVPAATAGTYTFSAATSGGPTATASFTVAPSLTVTPNSGPAGTAVVFRASGFASDVSISISAPILGQACSGTTALNGSFSCNYTFGPTASGAYSFTATDAKSNQASASFAVGAALSVSPTLGPVGTSLRFTATGFSGSTSISISWSGGNVCLGTTGSSGGFSCNTTMPAAALGSHTFTATAGPSASALFTVQPALSASPTSGGAGTSVTFNGTGFPSGAGVTVAWSGATSCNATVNASGGFSCAVYVPATTAGGAYLFTATDAFGDRASAAFLVETGLSASPNHAPAPAYVTFTGSNFAASSTVNLTWKFGTVCSVPTNASGGFTCAYTIPSATPGGTYTFTATDGAHHTSSVLYTVTFLTVSPSGVLTGTTVAFTGEGYLPGAPFTVRDPWGVACSGTVLSTGGIACQATIPSSATLGEHNFTAADTSIDVANASFAVFAISTPTASPPDVDLGQAATFSVTASGGGAWVKYAWNGLPKYCSSANVTSISCQPSVATGDASITVTVTDPQGFNATSPVLLFPVYLDPTQAPPTASSGTGDLGRPVTFHASVGNGSGGGTYVWTAAKALNCTASTGPTMTCTPTTTGSFPVSYNWTDSNLVSAVGSTGLSYTVAVPPTQTAPTGSPASIDVGETVTFHATVTGGAPGGTFVWTFSASLNCTASTGAALACVPKAAGTFSASFNWTDADGVRATGTATGSYTVLGDPTVTVPTASAASVDVGQSVTFSASATGGSGEFTYAWSGLPTGCHGTTVTVTCEPTAAEPSASVIVTAIDSNGFGVTSGALSFPVFSDPVVSVPLASPGPVDVGQQVSFSVSASGGSSALTYTWNGLPAGCSSANASTVTCQPSAATAGAAITVRVTDSNRFGATSPQLTYTVYADPAQGPPTASLGSADVGQKVTFSAAVTGGLAPGSYVWSASSLLVCRASTTSTFSCTASAAGTATVSYSWTDSNNELASGTASLPFSLFADPTLGVPTPSPASADVNETISFTAKISGGPATTANYTWTNSSARFGCVPLDKATIDCTPTAAGTYTVSVLATDSNGFPTPVVTSANFTVDALPSATPPVPSRTTVDAGQSLSFTATGSGGSGAITFVWAGTGFSALGCSASTTATLECTTTKTSGSFTVTVQAVDSNGGASPAVASPAITLSLTPTLTVPVPSRSSGDVGETITFTTTPSNGYGTLTYTWFASSSSLHCTFADAAQVTCQPTASGNYTASVSAVDANMGSSGTETSANFRVYAELVVTTVVGSPTTADVGQPVKFTATATGGLAPYTYSWTATSKPLGCPTGTASSLTCTPTGAGTFLANVTVTDANGMTSAVTSSTAFVVSSQPSLTLSVAPGSVLQGASVTFTASPSGGLTPYTFTWAALPSGCSATTTSTVVTCTPSDSGSYTVTVTVTDANKATAEANVTVTIQASLFGLPAVEGYAIVVVAVLAGLGALIFVAVRARRKRRSKRQQIGF